MKAVSIAKEEIGAVHFVHREVLKTPGAIAERTAKLNKAMTLGNAYKGKIRIIFETTDGLREVETTVWVAGDGAISLKGNVFIPVNCIHDVIL